MALRRTKDPGTFYDDVLNKFIKIVEWRVDDRYDTVVTASGAVADGAKKTFFQSLTNKNECDANFPQVNRIVGSGEEMIVERIGVYMPSAIGNTVVPPADIKKGAENFFVRAQINRDIIAEGAAIRFPSGYGLAGSTNENAAGIASIGVPSPAAAGKLARPHEVTMHTEVTATGTWQDHVWDATNMPTLAGKVWHRLIFHGLLKVAATRAG